jgi:leucyl-tRNA synthetase
MTQELWGVFGNNGNIAEMDWPKYDEEKTKDDTVTIAVQVNGKVRDQLDVAVDIAEEKIKKIALESKKVQKWLEGSEPKKVIYVKGRLVSVVV